MKRMILTVLLAAALMMIPLNAMAVGAGLNIRASRDVSDSVVYEGEDVDITVTTDVEDPQGYIWYHDGTLISDGNTPYLHISKASAVDSGTYTLDIVNTEGRVAVSVEAVLRVVDRTLPQTGDRRMPVYMVMACALAACLTAVIVLKRRKTA